jgi:endogenous inhibitor of DNA gyrase (YacG/DUF329 family)
MIKQLTCPVCRKPLTTELTSTSPTFPFCSERCRQVDLVRWFEGRYQVVEQINPRLAATDDEIGDDG